MVPQKTKMPGWNGQKMHFHMILLPIYTLFSENKRLSFLNQSCIQQTCKKNRIRLILLFWQSFFFSKRSVLKKIWILKLFRFFFLDSKLLFYGIICSILLIRVSITIVYSCGSTALLASLQRKQHYKQISKSTKFWFVPSWWSNLVSLKATMRISFLQSLSQQVFRCKR